MKILIVSAEVSPFAKVGGLADVAGALPKELSNLGHDVRVAMPAYPMVEDNPKYDVKPLIEDITFNMGYNSAKHAFIKQTGIGKVPVYLVGSSEYFREATESKKIYASGWEPYAFFAKATLEMLKAINWIPDVIHVNDWHTGFLPVYLKTHYAYDPALCNVATTATIHNLAYQGEFNFDILAKSGIPEELFNMNALECYGKVNFLKAGLVFSDMVNTVSETYACEIQTEEYGCRLDGLLRYMSQQDKLRGIINGIDYTAFDPETDSRIKANFNAEDTAGKAKCKAALQKELGLTISKKMPLIGMVTRLTDQKGLDILKKAMPKLIKLGVQMTVLGTGDPAYENYFASQAKKYPQQINATIGFDASLAQRIYAGTDMFLMPSRFEPCGLGQMIAVRYGSLPIVRKTGGLADTISEFDSKSNSGNGFVFEKYDSKDLVSAVERAVQAFNSPKQWKSAVSNAMNSDFSTLRCAKQYEALYSESINKRNTQAKAA